MYSLRHGLEPDLRCPESQPLFLEFGLAALREAGWRDAELALAACRFLESVADENGLVPPVLESAFRSPHAPHWGPAAALEWRGRWTLEAFSALAAYGSLA